MLTTHLRIEFIHTTNCLFDTSIFDSLPDLHPFLDHVLVDCGRDAGLPGEFNSCIRETLDDQVVEDQGIEITVRSASTTKAGRYGGEKGCSEVQILRVSSNDLGEIPTCSLCLIREESVDWAWEKTHLFETSAASSLLSQVEGSEACWSDTLLAAMSRQACTRGVRG